MNMNSLASIYMQLGGKEPRGQGTKVAMMACRDPLHPFLSHSLLHKDKHASHVNAELLSVSELPVAKQAVHYSHLVATLAYCCMSSRRLCFHCSAFTALRSATSCALCRSTASISKLTRFSDRCNTLAPAC